jgi:K+-sensing histidine kinase KdpD
MKEINVPWTDCVRFVRQLNHDIRNHLNALELQGAFLNEISPEGEVKDEIKRLRGTLSTLAGVLQKLSAKLVDPKLNTIPYGAADLMDDLKKKFERDNTERSARIKWEIACTNESIEVDPQLLQEALFELIDNAFQFSPADAIFTVQTGMRDGKFAITVHEPKAADAKVETSSWGHEPLRNARHGHYGLGLNRVRAITNAHGGELRADYDGNAHTLVTTILLPVLVAGT